MFGFGASSSRSSSSSSSYGYSQQGSLNLSDSLSQSRGRSAGQSTSGQSIAFEDLFARLFADAGGAAGRAAQAPVADQAAMLFSGGTRFLDELQGGADTEYLESRLGPNPVLDEQIGALGEDLGRFLREELNPAITTRGVATGTFGGGRQAVAQGRAADAVTREFQRGATDLRARDIAARDSVASTLQAGRLTGAQTGLNALPQLFGLSQGGALAELAPYQALAQIMGGPVALTQAQSTQFSEDDALSIAQSIAQSFGLSEDFSQSQSKSKSKSFSVGGLGGK